MFLMTDHSAIEHNRLELGEHGFAVGGTGTTVRSNVVSNSAGGIDVFSGASGIRVEGNALRDVGDGVIVGVASDTLVRHNIVDRTGGGERGGFGVILDGAIRTTVHQNVLHATGVGPAIYVAQLDEATEPRDNRVEGNYATSQHADGILVDPEATGTLLSDNVAIGSGDDGIDVDAPGTTLTGNIAAHNHAWGSRRSLASWTAAETTPRGMATPPSAPTSRADRPAGVADDLFGAVRVEDLDAALELLTLLRKAAPAPASMPAPVHFRLPLSHTG